MFNGLAAFFKRIFRNTDEEKFCHVYRPQPGIVEIRAGTRYGQGALLATRTEAYQGEAIPILLANARDRIGDRALVATPSIPCLSVPRVGMKIPGATDHWLAALPMPGDVWMVRKGAVENGFPVELTPVGDRSSTAFTPFHIRILERECDSLSRQLLRCQVVETGETGCVSTRLFGPHIRPRDLP